MKVFSLIIDFSLLPHFQGPVTMKSRDNVKKLLLQTTKKLCDLLHGIYQKKITLECFAILNLFEGFQILQNLTEHVASHQRL